MSRRIAVLVSTRIDPISGRATRSAADAAAVVMATGLDPAPALLAVGDMSDAVARDYLALGVPLLTRLQGQGDAAALLASAAADAALVLCGARSEGGIGSGLLPYAVAAALDRPLIADVVDVQPDADGWRVLQALARGARRRLRVNVPALLVLDARAPAAARHSYDAAQRGRIEQRRVDGLGAARSIAPAWQFEPAQRQLQALAARTRQSGHARMASAVGTAAGVRAGLLVQEGSNDDKARALLEHLRAHALIHI
jgi:electron transfer flavoprotein beta subunit